MGALYADRLDADRRAAFERGERVSRFDEVPGANLCAAWHPRAFVEWLLGGAGFELVAFVPGANRPLPQDSYLARAQPAGQNRYT